ncbi:transcription initiation Spt4 [Cystobasidium minutum MCA 4210]|uniref:transcription initiation Spt4 n=1 Tax=Cystobasidium minutum MCA 4210 TaxID=1397322 RepID=UPI0034CF0C9D|eukprot:jgi/Rhomi1/169580/fgenesh1_kg.3_\
MSSQTKKLRACLLCSLVQTPSEFRRDGCPNCEQLSMKGDKERVLECTTSAYDGLIAMVNPQDSWVARYQRIDKLAPGVYAVHVTGTLPEHVVDDLEASGITYRPRESMD